MRRIDVRKIISGLIMMAGGRCGLWSGVVLFGKGVRDMAGKPPGDKRPWSQILTLTAVAVGLMLGGKMLASALSQLNRRVAEVARLP
jgi:hypothetical protein